MVTDIDGEVIEHYLDNALWHVNVGNGWGEGYWIGRAIGHADQNAVDHDWLVKVFVQRGLDVAVIRAPKPSDPEPGLN